MLPATEPKLTYTLDGHSRSGLQSPHINAELFHRNSDFYAGLSVSSPEKDATVPCPASPSHSALRKCSLGSYKCYGQHRSPTTLDLTSNVTYCWHRSATQMLRDSEHWSHKDSCMKQASLPC